jgi:hypothetical protein
VTHYLYAVVDRLPTRWRPPTSGIAGAPVVPRRIEKLVVLASPLDSVPPASPRTLALHQDVVATVVDASATLPFRYGVAMPAAEVEGWLAGHRASVTEALGAVRGCVEMSVKLLRLERAIVHRLAGARAGTGPVEPGERDLQALAEALAERAALSHWRYQPARSEGHVAAAVAFLVPRSDLAGFLARIAPVASHAAGIAVVPTGPWAPYSFVPELNGASLSRVPAEASDALARRAG